MAIARYSFLNRLIKTNTATMIRSSCMKGKMLGH